MRRVGSKRQYVAGVPAMYRASRVPGWRYHVSSILVPQFPLKYREVLRHQGLKGPLRSAPPLRPAPPPPHTPEIICLIAPHRVISPS